MGKINYFNYCALAVLLILALFMLLRKVLHSRKNRYFSYVILAALASTLFDIISVELDNGGGANVTAKYVAHSAYLLLHNFTTPVYIIYLIELTDTWHKIRHNTIPKILLTLPFLSVVICTLTNPFTNIIFYLDENYRYTRGAWFWLLYLSAAIYLLYGVISVIRYRQLFNRLQFVSLMCMFLVTPVSVVIQFFLPYLCIEMFTQAVEVLFVLLVIQRPEDRLDSSTGCCKYIAYTEDLGRCFFNEKPIHIILIRLTNYMSLCEILGFEDTMDMLQVAVQRVKESCVKCSAEAEVYYFGKGQFALMVDPYRFPETEDLAEAVRIALGQRFQLKRMDVNAIAKLCLIRCPEDFSDFQSVLSFSDETEWQNRVGGVLHASELIRDTQYDMMHHMEAAIESAIAGRKFSVFYQPIYSVKEGRFNSAEALIRMKDDEYGLISPELFIPVAEKSGAIHWIGAYVLDEVCRFVSSDSFRSLGLDYIEVNLSVEQCMRGSLAREVQRTLDKYHVQPNQINLEITETAAAFAQSVMMDNVNSLAAAGIALTLDDFGSGYSNIQRMASMPLRFVKLGKSFASPDANQNMKIVVRNTIRMIKEMNLKIVAEGVETADMVKEFSELECDYIQGFYYSEPLSEEEFVCFMRQGNQR